MKCERGKAPVFGVTGDRGPAHSRGSHALDSLLVGQEAHGLASESKESEDHVQDAKHAEEVHPEERGALQGIAFKL